MAIHRGCVRGFVFPTGDEGEVPEQPGAPGDRPGAGASREKARICAVCGADLPPARRLYCSPACARIAQTRAGREKRESAKRCAVCDGELPVGKKRYCSKSCARVAHTEVQKRRRAEKRPRGGGGVADRRRRAVVRDDGARFCSMSEAARACGCTPANIHHALRSGGLARGHRWEYEDQPEGRESR